MLIVTAITASALAFIYVFLSMRVIGYRRKFRVSTGDGGEEQLLRAIRAQANLTEYAPIALILLACLELNRGPLWITSGLAMVFIVGRLLHPVGMMDSTSSFKPRVRGMQLTLLTIVALAVSNTLWLGWQIFI